MNSLLTPIKKVFVLILTVLFVYTSIGAPLPKKAEAIAGAEDVVSDPVTNAQEIVATIKEWGLDGLASSLLGYAGEKTSSVIVNKITGGGSSDKPSQVIQDFGQILMNTKTQQGDILVNQLTKKAADETSKEFSPYAKNFAMKLVGSASDTVEEVSSGVAANLPNFELKGIIGDNWKEYENDITLGGWDGLLSLGDPSSSAIGFNIQTGEELSRRINQRTEELKVKLTSNGLQPSKGKCDTTFKVVDNLIDKPKDPGEEFKFTAANYGGEGPSQPGGGTEIETSGNGFFGEDGLGNFDALDAVDETETESYEVAPGVKNQQGQTYDEAYKQYQTDKAAYQDWEKLNSAGVNNLASNATPCLIEAIQNPIGTVQNLANTALNSGIEKLSSGDEIGEMVGAFILSFVKGALNAGLAAVKSDMAQKKSKPVGGPEEASSDPSRWNKTPAKIIDMKKDLDPAFTNTGRELYYLERGLVAYDEYPKVIYALDQCVPRPKIGWKSRLTKLFTSSTKRLERATMRKNQKRADKAQDILDEVTVSMETGLKETELALLRTTLQIPGSTAMVAEMDKFGDRSRERKQLYDNLINRRAAFTTLQSIMEDIKGSMGGLYPTNFKPVLTRVEWENLTQAERDQNFTLASERTGQTLSYESLDTILIPEDFTPVYFKNSSERPETASLENKGWDELTEVEQDRAYEAAVIADLEIRNPGGDADSQCTDGIDNNNNGQIDQYDSGCTLPYILDNNEAQVTPPATNTEKRDKVMELTKNLTQYSVVSFYQWDRWNNGENIVLPENASSFKKQKSLIRERFSRLEDIIGNTVTIERAKQQMEVKESENGKILSLTEDCRTMRALMATFQTFPAGTPPGPGVKDNFLGSVSVENINQTDTTPTPVSRIETYTSYCPEITGKNIQETNPASAGYISGPEIKSCIVKLMDNPQSGVSFRNPEVINAFRQGGSILDRDCKLNAATDCKVQTSATGYYVRSVTNDDGEVTEENVNIPQGAEINSTTGAPYQQPTRFDIQNLFLHDNEGNLFCKFDDRMQTYQDDLRPVIKVGKPMTCTDDSDGDYAASKSQWYQASRGELMILYYPKSIDR